MIVSLQTLKAHLNLTTDFDDVLLADKLATATVVIGNATGMDLATAYTPYIPATYSVPTDLSIEPVLLTAAVESNAPAPIREAVQQYCAYLFEYREPVATGERVTALPYSLFDLIEPYRKWAF
jgi:Phage gp6-like head-tail connector protein